MIKKIILLSLVVVLCSCASGHRKTSAILRQHVTAGEFDQAIEYLKQSPLAEDQKSKLLYFTELGLLEHYRANYLESIKALSSAKEIIDELYTVRVSAKASSFLSNDNADFYYGEKYEASLVYFYLSLNYYLESIRETDAPKKKALLLNAKAEVVGWDSFLKEIKEERLGKAYFKEDLLAKTFGALVHESQGTVNDNQVALQLYKDAQDVFFKNYNLFPTFNAHFENFKSNFENFPNLPKEEVAGKYVLATDHSQSFQNFLNLKIKLLSQTGKPKSGNISFLVQDGLIAEKTPQKIEFPVSWGTHSAMAFSMGMGGHISFELPSITGVQKLDLSRIEAVGPDGQVITHSPLSVIAPLSELAEQAINEHSKAIAAKTATRVLAKHVTALVASQATYSAAQQKNNGMMMLLAIAGHAAAVAGINESEQADVRFWSTLPSNIRMGQLNLPPGIYKFRAVYSNQKVVDLGEHEVSLSSTKFVMNKSNDLPKVEVAKTKSDPFRGLSSVPALTPTN